MPTIKIETSLPVPAETAFQKVQEIMSNDSDLRKLDSNYQCQFDQGSLSGSAKGSKFEAKIKIDPQGDSQSKVKIEVSLALLLTPFKSLVEKTLKSKIELIG